MLPNDTQYIVPVPLPLGGVMCVAPNSVHYVSTGGLVSSSLAVNGYAHCSVTVEDLLPKTAAGSSSSALGGKDHLSGVTRRRGHAPLTPNPRPLQKLRLRLDGSRMVFVDDNVAILSLRGGKLVS